MLEKTELRQLFKNSSPLAVDGWCARILTFFVFLFMNLTLRQSFTRDFYAGAQKHSPTNSALNFINKFEVLYRKHKSNLIGAGPHTPTDVSREHQGRGTLKQVEGELRVLLARQSSGRHLKKRVDKILVRAGS